MAEAWQCAFLVTGDELTNGEIINTNSPTMAEELTSHGFSITTHLLVPDDEKQIENAIHYLRQKNDIVIITGGLGPTSDDRTRFALSKALNQPLQFNAASFQHITHMLARLKLTVHPSNEQQALFPESAEILSNPNGTANGCHITIDKKLFFMLPGPPKECLPMFKDYVLPKLLALPQNNPWHHYKWRLFGVSEGEMAAFLDDLLKDDPCQTGYRWDYPYLEFKIRTQQNKVITTLLQKIETALAPYIICPAESTATKTLVARLEKQKNIFYIADKVTHGLLQHTLTTPATRNNLHFVKTFLKAPPSAIKISIEGFTEFWEGHSEGQTSLTITITQQNTQKTYEKIMTFRQNRGLALAVEYIAFIIWDFLEKNPI